MVNLESNIRREYQRLGEIRNDYRRENSTLIPLLIEGLERELSDNDIDDLERESLIRERDRLLAEREILTTLYDGNDNLERERVNEERRRIAFQRHKDMMDKIKKFDNDDSGFTTNEEFIEAKQGCVQIVML